VYQLLTELLTEFVQTDWAKQMCTYCNINPTAYGTIRGMFESVRLVDGKLVVKLNRSFEQRSDKLLDKLVKHLRGKLPVQRLAYMSGSPPTTRTYII